MNTEEEDYMRVERRIVTENKQVYSTESGRLPHLPASGLIEDVFVESGAYRLGYVAGIVKSADLDKLKRALFRLTRGKIISNQISFNEQMMNMMLDPHDQESRESRSAFLIIIPFQESDSNLTRKIANLTAIFRAQILPLPKSINEIEKYIKDLHKRRDELQNLKEKVSENINLKLKALGEVNKVEPID